MNLKLARWLVPLVLGVPGVVLWAYGLLAPYSCYQPPSFSCDVPTGQVAAQFAGEMLTIAAVIAALVLGTIHGRRVRRAKRLL